MSELHYKNNEEIELFQFNQLLSTIKYLSDYSPFYKSFFKEHGIDPNGVKTKNDFEQIPFTTKDHLQDRNMDFLCVSKNEIADISSTSGTLGHPVHIAQTRNDLDRLALNESISFQIAGINENSLIQLMTTIDKRFMAGLAYYLGSQKLGSGIIRVGSGVPELQWDTILSLNPSVIISVPSFINHLINYAVKKNIDLKNTSVLKAICIGESVRNPDFSLNALGKSITEKWDIDLVNTYASTEMAAAFTECECKEGGHLIPELIFLEVLDDNGNHVSNGELGEVVITPLGIEGMPLLRYKTGDLCHLHLDKCKCGRTTPRLGPVVGRKKQMIKYKGTTIFPPAISNILNEFKEIENYIIELKSSEVGTDLLKVLIFSSSNKKSLHQNLTNRFKSKIRVVPEIEFLSGEELSKMQHNASSRKPVKFMDTRGLK